MDNDSTAIFKDVFATVEPPDTRLARRLTSRLELERLQTQNRALRAALEQVNASVQRGAALIVP